MPLFVAVAGRCRPPLLVNNAVATLNQTDRSVTISCQIGHRFPDGTKKRVLYCDADGYWEHIPHCDGSLLEVSVSR